MSNSEPHRIFLLSPANLAGIRAGQILSDTAQSEMTKRLRHESVLLGELFALLSGLYFRGKLAYARAFANPPRNLWGAYVITAGGGLISPETPVSLERVREISAGAIDATDLRYRDPLDRDLRMLSELAKENCQIVLLGSIATSKYAHPLLEILGSSLYFPAEFIGRGNLSRGGLLLRCVNAGVQLTYLPVTKVALHGARPPRLADICGEMEGGR